jgi:hypothetical protein
MEEWMLQTQDRRELMPVFGVGAGVVFASGLAGVSYRATGDGPSRRRTPIDEHEPNHSPS